MHRPVEPQGSDGATAARHGYKHRSRVTRIIEAVTSLTIFFLLLVQRGAVPCGGWRVAPAQVPSALAPETPASLPAVRLFFGLSFFVLIFFLLLAFWLVLVAASLPVVG